MNGITNRHRGRAFWAMCALLALCLGTGAARTDSRDPFDLANRAGPAVGTAREGDPFAAANKAQHATAPTKVDNVDNPTTRKLAELIRFQVQVTPARARPGQVIYLTINGVVKEGYHTYPATQKALGQPEGQLTRIEYEPNPVLKPLWPITESKSNFKKEVDGGVYLEHTRKFSLSQEILVAGDAKPGVYPLAFRIRLMVCDERGCVGPGYYPVLETKVDVDGPAAPVSEALQRRLEGKGPPIREITPPQNLGVAKQSDTAAQAGLWGLLASACVGAFLMLLTPCVFPMIPITVNFFLKQSEKEHHNPLLMASVYAGTIIILLALVMIVLGKVVITWANDPWFNLLLGGVLFFFALSLFGMYEIELPSGLARFTSAREGQGGYLGTVFMALTFTITSFTCTGPFLGALLGGVAGIQPPPGHLILAALVYSATFAAPFFLLALFPSMLRKLPKSGGWLNAVKVTMGFLEIGAALKFLANTDLAWNPGNPRIFSYDAVLCAWIALSFACGLYLIGAFRLPHDDPAEHIGVVRMMFATIFFGLAVYMTPALRRESPQGIIGEGLVAFLPPSFDGPPGKGNGSQSEPRLAWHLNYQTAWEEAKRDNKLIFIDFTGQNCTNCRANEKNVFVKAPVRDLLSKYVLVQLYTDFVPDSNLSPGQARLQAERNSALRDAVGSAALPYYVIFAPHGNSPFENGNLNGQVLGRRDGLIRDVQDFARFLQEPQQRIAQLSLSRTSTAP
jgi:thiol:disulfide interchange protein